MSDFGLQKSIADARIAVQSEYSLSSALERGLPYFGRQLAAFQSPPVRYALLAQFARSALRGKATGNILEVGSWAGASALTFGSVLQELRKADGHILCIDRWEKYFEAGDRSFHYVAMNDAIATGKIETLFRHNVRVCGLEDMVQVRKADSRKTLPELDGDAFDLVYIDGSHKKDDVVHDLREAKRLVRQGGVICGDDLEAIRSEVDPAAHQLALSRNQDFVVDPLSGRSYHPGVTEAVAALFPNVWCQHGFWCVERVGEDWKPPALLPDNLEIPFHLRHAVEIPYGVVHGYEVFQLGDGFVAYPMECPYWFQNRIAGGCLEEIVVLLESIEHMERTRAPRLIESRGGFNIVRYGGKCWVVNQSAGKVDFHDAEQANSLLASGKLFEADTVSEAKALIACMQDRRVAGEPLEGAEGRSNRRLTDNEVRVVETVLVEQEQNAKAIRALEEKQTVLEQRLGKREAELLSLQQGWALRIVKGVTSMFQRKP